MNKLTPCPFCGSEGKYHLSESALQEIKKIAIEIAQISTVSSMNIYYVAKMVAETIENKSDNKPLTIEELREMEGEPVYVVVIDKIFADKDDAINGWGLTRKSWVKLWDKDRADIVYIDHDFEDYGKTWLAYHRKPGGG